MNHTHLPFVPRQVLSWPALFEGFRRLGGSWAGLLSPKAYPCSSAWEEGSAKLSALPLAPHESLHPIEGTATSGGDPMGTAEPWMHRVVPPAPPWAIVTFRLSSGFRCALDPGARGQVGALGTALLHREQGGGQQTIQPRAPAAEAEPFSPAAGDLGGEPGSE